MTKEAVFTMKLEPALRDSFMAEAAAMHRPAAQIVRDLMRGYLDKRREEREYDEFVRAKVEEARAEMRAGLGQTNDEVKAEFAARRRRLMESQT
jgi:hypothetical protein